MSSRILFLIALLAAWTAPAAPAQQIPEGHILVDDMVLPEDFFLTDGLHVRNLWTTGIVPYEFDSPVAQADRDSMRDAMDILEAVCGVQFVKKNLSHNDWVQIIVSQTPGVSWSEVGRRGGRQRIAQAPGFSLFGNLHELMHTLGYHHEHQRPDRNTYITIHWQEIQSGQTSQFNIINETIIGPYDYDSVTHYGQYAFAVGSNPTITVNQSGKTIGQRNHVSPGDGAILVTHYGQAPLPRVTNTSPAALPVNPAGGQSITIFGDHFYKPYFPQWYGFNTNRGTEVFFNNVKLTSVTVHSSGTITATIPASLLTTPGRYPITVSNPQPGTTAARVSAPYWINVPAPASNTAWWGTYPGFGEEVEITGDLNSGGLREVLVSNPGNGSSLFGRVYVMSPENGQSLAVINDPSSYVAGYFGRALVDLGDVDGDPNSISDFAVGNPGLPVYGTNRQGRVLVYAGNNLNGAPLRTILPPTNMGAVLQFGYALANVGDLNNDNVNELAIGAPGWGGQSNAVHLYDGRLGTHLYSIQEIGIDDFGQTLAYMGGGLLAIGAPYYSPPNRFNAGYVAVYSLGATSAVKRWGFAHGFAGEKFGSGLAPAGDVDNDATPDVAITAPGATNGQQIIPSVLVYSGDPNKLSAPLTFYSMAPRGAPFQMRIADVGDINGDGVKDLAFSDYQDVHLLGMGTPTLTLLGTIAGQGGSGAYRGGLAGGKDIFSFGTTDLVTGAPYHFNSTGGKGLVEIQPVAASTYFGQGCSATAAPPRLVATTRPIIGQTYSLDVLNSYTQPGSYAVTLLVDVAPPANMPIFNCTSYVRLGQSALTVATVPLTPGVKNTFPIPISNVGPFIGLVLQAFVIDPAFNIDATNAQVFRTGIH